MVQVEYKKTNKSTTPSIIDGFIFKDKEDVGVYLCLKAKQKGEEISKLFVSPKFRFEINGEWMFTYQATFSFYDNRKKKMRYIDTRRSTDKELHLKRKIIETQNKIEIEIWRAGRGII